MCSAGCTCLSLKLYICDSTTVSSARPVDVPFHLYNSNTAEGAFAYLRVKESFKPHTWLRLMQTQTLKSKISSTVNQQTH